MGGGGRFKSDLFIEEVPSQAFHMTGALEKVKRLGTVDSQIFRKTREHFFLA